jgi:hypothetical protein
VSYIRHFLSCFQETIVQDFSNACLRGIDPNKLYLYDWIPAKGRSKGVLTRISVDRFDEGDLILHHSMWDKKLEIKWNLLNVYGPAHDEANEEFE